MQIDILGVKIDKISSQNLMAKIQEFLYSEIGHYIVTANPEIVLKAQKDQEYRDIINRADLVIPDGFGLILASKIILWKKFSSTIVLKKEEETKSLPTSLYKGRSKNYFPPLQRGIKGDLTERINGIDLIYKIANNFDNSAQRNKFFFLGARGENAKLTALKLKKKFPNIEIAGFFSGEASEEGDRIAIPIINQAKPDILFVAYGAPRQEKWISRNLKKIPSVKLAMGVGGAFDIMSGKISRAPFWMRKIGLEWFWRLIQEPHRIGRIYNATVKFMWLILIYPVRNKNHKIF